MIGEAVAPPVGDLGAERRWRAYVLRCSVAPSVRDGQSPRLPGRRAFTRKGSRSPAPAHPRPDPSTFGTGVVDPNARLGEQLARRLGAADRFKWEAINTGIEDTHTLQHLRTFAFLPLEPDVVVLLYVFNDMDYPLQNTDRPATLGGSGLASKLSPSRVLFLNSYLFQQLFVRWRKVSLGLNEVGNDPYANLELLAKHFDDLREIVQTAQRARIPVRMIPFDLKVKLNDTFASRYRRFVDLAQRAGFRYAASRRHSKRIPSRSCAVTLSTNTPMRSPIRSPPTRLMTAWRRVVDSCSTGAQSGTGAPHQGR